MIPLSAITPLPALSRFPLELGQWQGHDAAPFDAETVKILGAGQVFAGALVPHLTRWLP